MPLATDRREERREEEESERRERGDIVRDRRGVGRRGPCGYIFT